MKSNYIYIYIYIKYIYIYIYIYPAYVSKHNLNRKKQVFLLMNPNGEISPYLAEKNYLHY